MRKLVILSVISLLFSGSSIGQEQRMKFSVSPSIIPDGAEVEHLTGGFSLGEGPLWHPDGYLLCSDCDRDQIIKIDPVTGTEQVYLSSSGGSNGLAFDHQNRIIMCRMYERDIARLESDGSITVIASDYNGKRFNSPNDLVVRADGTIFFTDPFLYLSPLPQELGFDGIFAITPDGILRLLENSVVEPNGIALSPNGKRLYVNSCLPRIIYTFDIEDIATLTNKQVFTEIPSAEYLDGMKVDENGFLYATAPRQGIWIFSPDGELVDKIDVSGKLTNLNWGSDDYKTLFITSYTDIYKIELNTKGLINAVVDLIYPINCSISSNYLATNNDQIIIQTEFGNSFQHNFIAQAIINGLDVDFIDTLQLYDDGLHYDNNPDDSIYGNIFPSFPYENLFSMYIKSTNLTSTESINSYELHRFTTIGPVTVSSFEFIGPDKKPDPGDQILFNPILVNKGNNAIAGNVTAKILSLDTTFANISENDFTFGHIPPGQTIESSNLESYLQISSQCPDSTLLNFAIEVTGFEYVYWRDTFQIKVGYGFVSGRDDILLPVEEDISIFPNPTSGTINITGLTQPATIKIYNLQGQLVKSFYQVQKYIDLTDLDKGVYILNLEFEDQRVVRKVVKE